MPKKNKYGNKNIIVDGIKFDSRDEARFYTYLMDCKAKEMIQNFELQPKYELQPKFKGVDGKSYQAITYTPDFFIYHLDGSVECIDVKTMGTATQQGELRKKMFIYKYPNVKLTWVSRHISRATFGGEWILYDDLKKQLAKEANEKKKQGGTDIEKHTRRSK